MQDSINQDGRRVRVQTLQLSAAGTSEANSSFHIVGVGASAGGLEALETFFDHIPVPCGMAFVVVQHLSPDFKSMMDELLARHTKMDVHRVEDGMVVEPNSIYLIPPKKEMIIQDGQLLLSDKDPSQGLSLPIDTFFRSLAQDVGDRSIGIILSGTGSDGSRGVKAIHDAGGLVIVQTEESARFDGMPKSAIETGIVDLVLAPEEISDALGRFGAFGMPGLASAPCDDTTPSSGDALNSIFKHLRLDYGIDFSWYKKSNVSGRMVSFVDITKRKRAEEQRESYARELELANETLRHAEQEARDAVVNRDRFLATLSHELSNPLAGLLNAQRVLEHESATREDKDNASLAMKRQAQHMSHLLNDLLDVARVTQGKIDFQKCVFDVRELVPDAVQTAEALIHEKKQVLHIEQPEKPLMVEGDPARLLQVLENLLVNAAKYTPPKGRIELQLKQDQTQCMIVVRDSGRGIKPELLENIFDMFVQADETLDRREGGMGVGLTLVHSLVKMHGGTVTAHSEGEEKGSEFTVRLPLTYKRTRRRPSRRAAESDNGNNDGDGKQSDSSEKWAKATNVLLVEDNADARQMLRTLLELDGHHVEVAEDGRTGLEILLRNRPDVALVDIGIPELSGYDVARGARSKLARHEVYLVALTGYGQQSDRDAVFDAGFDEHLVKPVNPSELSRVLNRPRQPK